MFSPSIIQLLALVGSGNVAADDTECRRSYPGAEVYFVLSGYEGRSGKGEALMHEH